MEIPITIIMPVRSRTPTIIAPPIVPIMSTSSLVGTTVGVAVTARNIITSSQTVYSHAQDAMEKNHPEIHMHSKI